MGAPRPAASSPLDHSLKVELPNPPNLSESQFLAALAAKKYKQIKKNGHHYRRVDIMVFGQRI